MHYITQSQRVTTCPQCDNIVLIDAEFCNICGKRLRPVGSRFIAEPDSSRPQPSSHESSLLAPDDDQYEDDEYDEDDNQELAQSSQGELAPAPGEILAFLHRLQEQAVYIERYFPAQLSDKAQKITAWKKQLQRALSCAELFEQPQLQLIESEAALKLRHHLAEAAHALDFTREYTVKLIGHTGAGKSTLLAALLGRDIFPRLAGGAVTGVRTRVRLCGEQEAEEMRVHFLTRAQFDTLLRQTQRAIQDTASEHAREALSTELSILLKASEAFAEHYLSNEEPYIEIIPRERWREESSRYIEEPPRDSAEPRLIRLIDYVEYTIRADSHSLLPPGSVLVDLPGGSAGQVRHDAVLRHELSNVDAILVVVGNNRFGDDERTQHIFELVRQRVIQSRSPEVAARMVFLAVTHWDEIAGQASLEKALGSLRPLLRELPASYSNVHHHGPGNGYFFYPIRGNDALLARLGLERQPLDVDRLQEGRDYAGHILSVYPDLLKLDPTLPPTAAAQEYQKVSGKQHDAMLRYSGLPELFSDLQAFLTNNRYDVQLRQAETQLALALQQLEDLCWERLNQLGVNCQDVEELQYELSIRQSKRSALRFEQLQRRTSEMHNAWQDALKQFDLALSLEQNAFHQVLQTAHDRAARRVKIRILQGHFDHYIKVGKSSLVESPAMEIGSRWTDIDGWSLIRALRVSFSAALERELNEPARTLAEAFLIPITHKEELDGSLNITQVALGEYGGELDEIQKAYNRLKRGIREKARDICLYVTMGELLNEEKYAPAKDDPAVSALYRLISTAGKPEDLMQQARQLMAPILDVICGQLAESTERRIAHLFRYELDKLEVRQVYENERLDAPPGDLPGAFADLVNRLYSLLTERVLTSERLREQLDTLQAQREVNVDRWVDMIRDIETLKMVHY